MATTQDVRRFDFQPNPERLTPNGLVAKLADSSNASTHGPADPPLMQFDLRLGPPRDHPRHGVERHLRQAVQGELMPLVKGLVHQARQPPLDEEIAADERPHQIADRRVSTEGNERPVVAIVPRLEGRARKAPPDLLYHVRRLLVGGLGSWRNIDVLARPGTRRTITDGEDIVVARRLQCRGHDELIEGGWF